MHHSFTTVKPPKSYDELYEAVRKNFPHQLTIEKPDAIITADNGFNAPLYASFGLNLVSPSILTFVLPSNRKSHTNVTS
jgi:hypothetical protein